MRLFEFEVPNEYSSKAEVEYFIKNNCKEWMAFKKSNPDIEFYKGLSHASPYVYMENLKRTPKDSHGFAHKVFTKVLKDKTGTNLRENSFIVTLDPNIAHSYGNVFVGIPVGEFNVYRTNILDMYLMFMDYVISAFVLMDGIAKDNNTQFKNHTGLKDELEAYESTLRRLNISAVSELNEKALLVINDTLYGDMVTAHSLVTIIYKYFNDMYKEMEQGFMDIVEVYKDENAIAGKPKHEIYIKSDNMVFIKKNYFDDLNV